MGGYGWFEVGMGGNGWLQVVKSGYEWFGLPDHRLYSTICPRYVQCMPEICATFAQGMGIQIDKVGQNIAGEGALVGTLCRRGGARSGGTFCLLT